MEIISTGFQDLFLLETPQPQDARGQFRKLFNFDFFRLHQLETEMKEFYYSVSRKHVIRGMHFQLPPFDHAKLVYVSHGRITDVVIDLRKRSATYGRFFRTELDASRQHALYIPRGFAHGFLSEEEGTVVHYAQTSCYSQPHDAGIAYDSFGFDWGVEAPVVSDRDRTFGTLENFQSPFE